MTRLELLRLVIGRARSNGFEFRRWYTARLDEPWVSAEVSLQRLEEHRRYYALLFSHDFARSFWKAGSEFTFQVEAQSFQRRSRDGTIATVSRKAFTRRSARKDAWRFHLREMPAAEEPLRYIRRYLHVEEAPCGCLTENDASPGSKASPKNSPASNAANGPARAAGRKAVGRPLPQGPPAFLRRPYDGQPPNSGPSA